MTNHIFRIKRTVSNREVISSISIDILKVEKEIVYRDAIKELQNKGFIPYIIKATCIVVDTTKPASDDWYEKSIWETHAPQDRSYVEWAFCIEIDPDLFKILKNPST